MLSGLNQWEIVGNNDIVNDDSTRDDNEAAEHDYFNSDLFSAKLKRRVLTDNQRHLYSEQENLPTDDVIQPEDFNEIESRTQFGMRSDLKLRLPNSDTAMTQPNSNNCVKVIPPKAKSTENTMYIKKNDIEKNQPRPKVNTRGRGRRGGRKRGGQQVDPKQPKISEFWKRKDGKGDMGDRS